MPRRGGDGVPFLSVSAHFISSLVPISFRYLAEIGGRRVSGEAEKVQHHRALPIDDMPGFVAALRQRDGVAARCLEFVVLTACRSGEARGARWSEIDLAAKLWTIPPERMKAGKPHRVPLSAETLAVLEALPRMARTDLVFLAPRGGQLSDMALLAVMRRMGVDAVPHGARSTFSPLNS